MFFVSERDEKRRDSHSYQEAFQRSADAKNVQDSRQFDHDKAISISLVLKDEYIDILYPNRKTKTLFRT